MIKNYLTILVIALMALPVRAADASSSYSTSDPRSNVSTIFFAGVGGAVLGLSTLSFYGRPQDHMPNIAIGFAVGIIFGTGYVTIKAAHPPATSSQTTDYVPNAELEMAMNSGRAAHSVGSDLTPAQWNWSF